MAEIVPTTRVRPSPFYASTLTEGVTGFTVYNRMLMPTGYGDPEAEYWRLIEGVSQWDVAVERQVELVGPDAAKLAQILCLRNLSNCKVGQGKYAPICNHDGIILNDPIILKLEEDRYFLSIADSNIEFWATAIAHERRLNVRVFEPDVSPMALQGPKAEAVMAHIFGDWVKDLKYFWFKTTELEGIPLIIQRSGWSKQGGFELYLCDHRKADHLWNLVKEAGRAWDIGPGYPNPFERIESGLLSYGNDTDAFTNPLEVRLEAYTDLDLDDDVIGSTAIRKLHAEGIKRHQLGFVFDEPLSAGFFSYLWLDLEHEGQKIGDLTNYVTSPRLKKTIGFALISRQFQVGDQVEARINGQLHTGTLVNLPFV